MLLTIGNTVIMLSVGSEPSDFSFQVAVAQIALCGSHLLIRKKLSFITELPGNILRIIIKNYMNLIPLIMGTLKPSKETFCSTCGSLILSSTRPV